MYIETPIDLAGFEVLTEVDMKSAIFFNIIPYGPLKANRLFGGIYHLHLHVRRISQARNQRDNRWHAKCPTCYPNFIPFSSCRSLCKASVIVAPFQPQLEFAEHFK
jgi:hypothetical protein